MKQLIKKGLFLIFSTLTPNLIFAQVTDALVITPQGNVNVVNGKVQEAGNDLLPKGAIIMWHGTEANVPNGWAICDGILRVKESGKYIKIDKKDEEKYKNEPDKILPPDLRDRFVLGAGGQYNTAGGNASVKIEEKHLPPHSHEVEPSGEHSHVTYYEVPTRDADSNNYRIKFDFNGDVNTGLKLSSYGSQSAGSHTHTIKKTGNGDELQILPPYYALYYIIKL